MNFCNIIYNDNRELIQVCKFFKEFRMLLNELASLNIVNLVFSSCVKTVANIEHIVHQNKLDVFPER